MTVDLKMANLIRFFASRQFGRFLRVYRGALSGDWRIIIAIAPSLSAIVLFHADSHATFNVITRVEKSF